MAYFSFTMKNNGGFTNNFKKLYFLSWKLYNYAQYEIRAGYIVCLFSSDTIIVCQQSDCVTKSKDCLTSH